MLQEKKKSMLNQVDLVYWNKVMSPWRSKCFFVFVKYNLLLNTSGRVNWNEAHKLLSKKKRKKKKQEEDIPLTAIKDEKVAWSQRK